MTAAGFLKFFASSNCLLHLQNPVSVLISFTQVIEQEYLSATQTLHLQIHNCLEVSCFGFSPENMCAFGKGTMIVLRALIIGEIDSSTEQWEITPRIERLGGTTNEENEGSDEKGFAKKPSRAKAKGFGQEVMEVLEQSKDKKLRLKK